MVESSPMMTIGEFHDKVLSGNYTSPEDHLPARPLRQGLRAWWRFYVSGLAKALGKGLREFKKASNALTQALNAEPAPQQTAQPVQQSAPQSAPAPAAQTAETKAAEEPAQPAQPAYKPPTQESVRQQLAEQGKIPSDTEKA